MLVLLVFLADWRTALISSVAIPLSLLAAGLLLHYRGGTLDTMVLAGLVIALGEVVDDAIIDVENIIRRLRLNRAAEQPRSAIKVVLDASMEVRSAVLYGSMIVVVVFLRSSCSRDSRARFSVRLRCRKSSPSSPRSSWR